MLGWHRIGGCLAAVACCLFAANGSAQDSDANLDLKTLFERLDAAERRILELEAGSPSPFDAVIERIDFLDDDQLPGFDGDADSAVDPDATAGGKSGKSSSGASLSELKAALDKRIRKLEDNYEKSKEADRTKSDAANAKPTALLTCQLQTDYVWFGQSPNNQATFGPIQDGADFRRARLGVYGEIFETVDYRMEYDFAFIERPAFLDNWIGWRKVPIFNTIKVGRYFEPFGLERFTSNRFTTFMERALGDQAFDPARRNGVSFYNNNDDGSITWAAGVFRSFTDFFGDNVATEGAWAGTARLTWMPWYDEGSGGRYYMHFGADYSYRAAGEGSVTFRAQPEIRMRDQADPLNVPFFVNTGTIPADHWQLIGGEFALILNRFSVQSEYVYTPVARTNGPNPAFQSVYVYATYFLTNDYRPFQKMDSLFQRRNAVFDRVIPSSNFLKGDSSPGNPRGIGAFELAARWSYIDLNDQGIKGGRLNEMTLGLNWYINPFTRITLNYVRSFLDNPDKGKSTLDSYGMRFGFDF